MSTPVSPDTELGLIARLEAMLFVAPGLVTASQLAAALEIPVDQVVQGLEALQADYLANKDRRGLRLQRDGGRYQLTTAAETGLLLERFLGLEASSRLSRATVEALAVIAYQQPVTRPQVDAVRGVNSDGVLKSLLNKGLVQEAGRAETPGRPILYCTTTEFLQYFGIDSLADLPPLQQAEPSTESPVSEAGKE